MSQSDFWDKPAEAQASVAQLKVLKRLVDPWKKVHQEAADLEELLGIVVSTYLLFFDRLMQSFI